VYSRVVAEAPLEDSGSGLIPVREGWFVVNVRDAEWWTSEQFGSVCSFENEESRFPDLGFSIAVLERGKPNCLYHAESKQEAFLVLAGECRLLVEGEERLLGAWDFFHCSGGTEHVLVGAGDAPCVVLMTGPRGEGENLVYPVSELAARYGASVARQTPDPSEAYAPFEPHRRERPKEWDALPWA
jgi:uncharacterized cupin superfamily protein